MTKNLKRSLVWLLYIKYLKTINIPFNLYLCLLKILKQNQYYLSPTNTTIVYDTLLFWHENLQAQQYIIYLYTKVKYNIHEYDFKLNRYNLIWALRRNFFLRNIMSIYPLPTKKAILGFKSYIILRQLLDDIIDINEDAQENIISLANQKTSLHTRNYFKQWLSHHIKNNNLGVIAKNLLLFYFQFL